MSNELLPTIMSESQIYKEIFIEPKSITYYLQLYCIMLSTDKNSQLQITIMLIRSIQSIMVHPSHTANHMKYTNNQYCIIHEIGEKACIYIKTFGIMVYVPDVI